MRVLFVHTNFPGQFRHLAPALAADLANEVHFLTFQPARALPGVHKVVCRPHRPPSREIHPYLAPLEEAVLVGQAAYRGAKALRRRGFVPDVVVAHSGMGAGMFLKDAFPEARMIGYFEWYYDPNGANASFLGPLDDNDRLRIRTMNASVLLDLAHCDTAICPTVWQKEQFPAHFRDSLHVLHDGIDTDACRPSQDARLVLPILDLSAVAELVTYVARGMEPYRGFPQFMQALAELQRRRPGLHGVIVGDDRVAYGPALRDGESWKKRMITELDLDPSRTHFTGPLPYAHYLQVLQASAVHVYLTVPFVLSWSMLEAMAAGCLLVASDTAPVREVVEDGVNGLLVDFFDVAALADRIEGALRHPDRHQALRAAARTTVLERYRLERMLPEQRQLIHRVASSASPPRMDPDLLAWVPLDARRVLEVGPRDGSLAASLRARNPVVHCSATDIGGADATDGAPYDAIVGDTTLDLSVEALERLGGLLRPGGHVVFGGGSVEQLGRAGFRVLKAKPMKGFPPRTVVVAERVDHPPRPGIHIEIAAFAPRYADARARLPARQLESVPGLTVGYRERVLIPPALPPGAAGVLVLQRHALPAESAWVPVLARAIRAGWIVVAELDDHPDLIDSVKGRAPRPTRWLPLIGAHAVQTSTEALAHVFRGYNPEVAVFANAVFTLPPFPEPRAGPVRVFYGAFNRGEFSSRVAAALAPAIAAGPEAEFEVVHDRAFFDALPTTRKRFRPALAYEDYLCAMDDCDIALMPLEGTPAQLFKSDIKYVEAASRGTAPIASAAVYASTIVEGKTGLIAREIADWAPALARLFRDPALRQRLARAAWEDVRDRRMFALQATARRDWYADLWARRRPLEAALMARLPSLGEALETFGGG